MGNKYLYNLEKYLIDNGIKQENEKKYICYCRVSSRKQIEDLNRQIDNMKNHYPNHIIIKDIASGLNFKRPGLQKIIDMAVKGEIKELVVSYKDRLARIGFEMIEYLIETYSGGKIIVINKSEEETPNEEMVKDVISIMNIYVAKMNGLRKYKKQLKEDILKN